MNITQFGIVLNTEMHKTHGWLFPTLIFHANVFVCNHTPTASSRSTLTTNSISISIETNATNTSTNTISTDGPNGDLIVCTTAGISNNGSTMKHSSTSHDQTIICIGISAVVAVVVLVAVVSAAYYYMRRRSRQRTKARKDIRFSYNNIRISVTNTDNPNVNPPMEWDNQMPQTTNWEANAVYASVQMMRPRQNITQRNTGINTMDSTYNHTSKLPDDTYDSTITCGKISFDDTYDNTNFKTSYLSTCDIYENASYTRNHIYDPDVQQTINDLEPTYELTLSNVNGETNGEPFYLARENVDEIYNNM